MVRARSVALVTAAALTLLAAVNGCGRLRAQPAAQSAPSGPSVASGVARNVTVDLDGRPFRLHIPASYRTGTPAALVVLLHGYTSSGAGQEAYLKLTPESDRRGFLYAT